MAKHRMKESSPRAMDTFAEFEERVGSSRAEVKDFFKRALATKGRTSLADAARESGHLVVKANVIKYAGEAWVAALRSGARHELPVGFDRDRFYRLYCAALFLEATLWLFLGELWFSLGAAHRDEWRDCYRQARAAHRRAVFHLTKSQGTMLGRLMRRMVALPATLLRLTPPPRGIDALRADASRVRATLAVYQRVIVRGGDAIDLAQYNAAARLSNTVIVDHVRDVYARGPAAAAAYGPSALMAHVIHLMGMSSQLAFARGSIDHRRSLAAIQILLAMLHWAVAQTAVDASNARHASFVFKHEEYARRSLRRYHREMGNTAWAVALFVPKLLLGTFERRRDRPEWEALLPGAWEAERFARFLRQQFRGR